MCIPFGKTQENSIRYFTLCIKLVLAIYAFIGLLLETVIESNGCQFYVVIAVMTGVSLLDKMQTKNWHL